MTGSTKELAAPDIVLERDYLKAMYFEVDDRQPFERDPALPYDAQYNIVVDLLGRVLESTPRDLEIATQMVDPGLFEVCLTHHASSFCVEDGKDYAEYNSQLVYAGLFRVAGEMDSAMEQRCATFLVPHMKRAVDKFIDLSGSPKRFSWRFL